MLLTVDVDQQQKLVRLCVNYRNREKEPFTAWALAALKKQCGFFCSLLEFQKPTKPKIWSLSMLGMTFNL